MNGDSDTEARDADDRVDTEPAQQPFAASTLDAGDPTGRRARWRERAPPETIGPYEVLNRLGAGGMGVVYRVLDPETGAILALKTGQGQGADDLLQLKSEFRSRVGLVHPNLLRLNDLVVDGEDYYVTMELLDDAVDLLAWINAHDARDWAGRLRDAIAQLVRGLAALHEFGTVHRDIKPSNVLVTPQGRVVILDFGLAARDDARAGEVVGTVPYMAPEQTLGAPSSSATDLYAVGVLLYEALTGGRPHTGTVAEVFAGKRARAPTPPRALFEDVPEDLSDLTTALLRVEPDARPDADETLRRLGAAPRDAGPPGACARLPFVGCAREPRGLDGALREVIARACPVVVTIHGPSGIGKTRLIERFLERARARVRGPARPLPPARADPVQGARRGDRRARAGAAGPRTPGRARGATGLRRRARAPVPLRSRARCSPPRDGAAASIARAPPDAQELRLAGFAALRELLATLATARPLVIWIDDAQWGDPDSASLLDVVLRSPGPLPLLLLASTQRDADDYGPLLRPLLRPGLRASPPSRADEPRHHALSLAPLEPAAVETLLRAGDPDRERRGSPDALVRQCEGNAFFACEPSRASSRRGRSIARRRCGSTCAR
ncbi:MAG: serine/threonine-protein kinase PknK [Myxococcales bacterium]|nr:serine/threonine-protein kinase PknK [Myxococcales bacterium]